MYTREHGERRETREGGWGDGREREKGASRKRDGGRGVTDPDFAPTGSEVPVRR